MTLSKALLILLSILISLSCCICTTLNIKPDDDMNHHKIRGGSNNHNRLRKLITANNISNTNKILKIEIVNVDTDLRITDLANNTVINLSEYPSISTPQQLNYHFITNNITQSINMQYFSLSNVSIQFIRNENSKPYSLCSDINIGDYQYCRSIQLGLHKIIATPYPLLDVKGTPGKSVTISFSIINETIVIPPTSVPITTNSPVKSPIKIPIIKTKVPRIVPTMKPISKAPVLLPTSKPITNAPVQAPPFQPISKAPVLIPKRKRTKAPRIAPTFKPISKAPVLLPTFQPSTNPAICTKPKVCIYFELNISLLKY